MLAAPDAQLHSANVKGGGRMTVAVSPSQHDGVAVMSDLPALPEGKVYQLWLITGTSPKPSTVMAAGQTSGRVFLPALGTADTLGVTVEPVGGSEQPSSEVLSGVPLI